MTRLVRVHLGTVPGHSKLALDQCAAMTRQLRSVLPTPDGASLPTAPTTRDDVGRAPAGPVPPTHHEEMAMIKLTLLLTRRADLTREQFAEYWKDTHWPIVQTVPEVKAYTRRYVQQHNIGGVPAGVTAAPYDGIAEAWFDDMASALAVMSSPRWAAVVAKDDENFLDRSKTLVMFSDERVDYTR